MANSPSARIHQPSSQSGTLAAIGVCVGLAPNSLLRVHDVEATRDYLAVLAALEGGHDLAWDEPLADELRYDRP